MKKRFLEKFDDILKQHYDTDAIHNSIVDKPFEKYETGLKANALSDKAKVFFRYLLYSLPEDTREMLYKKFEQTYIKMKGDQQYKPKKDVIPDAYPTPEAVAYSLFYACPDDLIKSVEARNMIEEALEFVDDTTLEGYINEIDSYESPYLHNVKIYPLRYPIEQIKERNKTRIADEEQRNAINAELDLIAEIVVTSSSTYSNFNGELFDSYNRDVSDKRLDELNAKALAKEENQHLNDYFETLESGEYRGIRSVNDKHYGDLNMINVFTDEKIKMVFSEDRKNSLRKVLNYMREKNMLSADQAAVGDQGSKVYGFKRIYDAHNKLVSLLESDDLAAIRSAREEYQTQIENMRGLYKMVKEEFNLNVNMMLQNIISYRESWVPNEFKNDVVCNAWVNGIFNLSATLEHNNVTLEEMFENPNKAFFNILKRSAETAMPSATLGNKSNAEAIHIMASGQKTGEYTAMGLGRNMEFLQALSYGTDAYEQNSLAQMLIQSYAIYITGQMTIGSTLVAKDYLKANAAETMSNMILINPADRNLDKLCAVPKLNTSATEVVQPFSSMDYITSHNINPTELIERMKSTVSELESIKANIYENLPQKGRTNVKAMSPTVLRDAVYGAQMAAYKYLLVHPAPSEGFMTESEFESLKMIAEDPLSAFGNSISADTKKAIEKSKSPLVAFVTDGQGKFDAARTEAREAEQAYANNTADLRKRFATLSKQLNKGKGNVEAIREDYNRVETELNALKEAELKRLDKAYTDGKLPKTYYELRRLDVENGKLDNTVPFSASECPKFSKFKAQYKEELSRKELTLEEVQVFYDRMVENVLFEENKLKLIATGNHPKPELYSFSDIDRVNTTYKYPIQVSELKEKNDGLVVPKIVEANTKRLDKHIN